MKHLPPNRVRISTLSLAAILVATLALAAPALAQTGTPRIDPQDPHRFVMNGQPWLATGYTPGLGAMTLRRDGVPLSQYYPRYHTWLSENGINTYRAVFSMGQIYRGANKTSETIPYQMVKAVTPTVNLDNFNQAHFNHWRAVIQDAAAKGIVVQLSLFDSWHLNQATDSNRDGWAAEYDFYYGPNNVNGVTFDKTEQETWHTTDPSSPVFQRQKALVDKIVDELGGEPNIIWEVCNEADDFYETWAQDLGQYLQQKDMGRHLVNPLDYPDHQHTPGQTDLPGPTHSNLVAAFNWGLPLITHNDTNQVTFTAVEARKKAWAALTAGAHIDFFFKGERLDDFFSGDHDYMPPQADGGRWIGLLPKFVNRFGVRLSGMEPSDDLVSGPVPGGSWCLARPGDEYVIYKGDLSGNGSVILKGPPSNFRARWFSPRNGSSNFPDAVGVSVPDGLRFTPPNPNTVDQDWVLHVVALEPTTETITVTPYADARVQQANRFTNYGSAGTLSVRNTTTGQGIYSFLRFNVPNLNGAVVSAKLRIRTRFTTVPDVALYRVNSTSWSEGTVNWDTWDANGVTLTPIGSATGLLGNRWHAIDVSAGISGNGSVDLGVVNANGGDVEDQDFWSSESSYSPYLRVSTSTGQVRTFYPPGDAWIGQDSPDANHGFNQELRVRPGHIGRTKYSLLRFNVSGLSGSVQSATLHLRTQETYISEVSVLKAQNIQWSEGAVTFESWNQNGMSLTYVGTEGPLAAGTSHELDVTSAVTGGGDLVLGLTSTQDAPNLHFWSKESGYVPELVITTSPQSFLRPASDSSESDPPGQEGDGEPGQDEGRAHIVGFG